MKVDINTPQGLKTIGQIVREPGGLVLEKQVSLKKHLFKVADAWGVQFEVFQKHPDLSLIRLQEVDSGVIYEISVHRFLRLAFERDFGYGRQLFVTRDKWHVKPGKSRNMSLVRPAPKKLTSQMELF